MIRAAVKGIGMALPQRRVKNAELSEKVDTSDEWIFQRTGIRERRVVSEGETTQTLALAAAQDALARAGISGEAVDFTVLATISPDQRWPASACFIQDQLGSKGGAYDVSAACAGFVYALDQGAAMIETGRAETVLVVGADTLTTQLDWTDRGTCVLFGDGAGAVVLQGNAEGRGLLSSVLLSDGAGTKHLGLFDQYLTMNGKEVYRFAVKAMGDACERVIEKAGLQPSDIDLFVPHQANVRIISAAAERMGLSSEKVFVNVDRYGNTSGGSIPIALAEAEREGLLKPGMLVLTVGFGGGLVWGANLIRW
ncbi:ketoacyl-ACP synthase III [bacterium]|nr:MAG: ketoacyl-ACP synthase III [bacterium]